MRNRRLSFWFLALFLFGSRPLGISAQAADQVTDSWLNHLELKGNFTLFGTPQDGQTPFVTAINSAKQGVLMTMFHLSAQDPTLALINVKKRNRLADVRVILDGASLKSTASLRAVETQLVQNGVVVRPSSSKFTITHEKAMVLDDEGAPLKKAFVTSINLTTEAATTRDYGVITTDPGVVAEVTSVFETDWKNADPTNFGKLTPVLQVPNLMWSPVSSKTKLVDLINSVQPNGNVMATVENLEKPETVNGMLDIQNAFLDIVKTKNATLQIIVPLCDKNPDDPYYNYSAAKALKEANAQVRMMPGPETAQQPYMHSKMILVDGVRAYVGSVNFTKNSVLDAREAGIVFENNPKNEDNAGVKAALNRIQDDFKADWAAAVEVPDTKPTGGCRP